MLDGRISAGNALHLAKYIRCGQWRAADKWLHRAAREADRRSCNRVLLSSEWLLEALARDGSVAKLTSCLDRVGASSVEFLLVLRDPVGQFVSLYKHRAKRGTVHGIESWAEEGYDLPHRLAGFRHQVEADDNVELVVRRYEKDSGSLEQLFFGDWLGIAIPEESSDLRVNSSLSLSELVLLRQLNSRHPGLVPYLYDRLSGISPDQKREGRNMLEHAHRVAIQSVSRHGDEWSRWNKMLPTGERFDVPEAGVKPGAEPDTLELSSEQLCAVMQLLGDALGYRLRLQVLWSWRLRPVLARIKQVLFPGLSRR